MAEGIEQIELAAPQVRPTPEPVGPQITASDLVGITPSEAPRQFAVEAEDRPSVLDAMANAAMRENQTLALYHILRDAHPDGAPDPTFNPFRFIDEHRDEFGDLVPLATGDESERFMGLQNEAQFRRFADLLRQESKVKDISESHGALAYMAGGVGGILLDPASWLSGAAIGKAYAGWRLATRLGTMTSQAALGAAFAGQHEAVMQMDQVLRTPEESYMAIGMGAGLGAFGSLFSRVRGADVPGGIKPMQSIDEAATHPLSPDSTDVGVALPSNPETIAAYATEAKSLSAAARTGGTQAGPGASLGAIFDKVSPIGRTVRMSRQFVDQFRPKDRAATSAESLADDAVGTAYSNMDKLVNTRVVTEANLAGEASPQRAEDLIRQLREITVTRAKQMHDLHGEMLRDVFKDGTYRSRFGVPKIGVRDFEQEVYRYRHFQSLDQEANYRPTDGLSLDTAEEVSKFHRYVKRAAGLEDEFYDLWGKLQVRAGMLKEEEVINHYFPQMYERDVIAGNVEEFKALLRQRFAREPDPDWLETHYETRDINTLSLTDRDLARADWESSNRLASERAADAAMDRAVARLESATGGVREAKKDVTLTRAQQFRKALNDTRMREREFQKELQASAAERELLKVRLDELQDAGTRFYQAQRSTEGMPIVPTFNGVPVRVTGVADDLTASLRLADGSARRKVGLSQLEWKAVDDVTVVPKDVLDQLQIVKEFEVKAQAAMKRVNELEKNVQELTARAQKVALQRKAAESEFASAKELSSSARKTLSAAQKERKAALTELRKAKKLSAKVASFKSTDEQVDDIVTGLLNYQRSPFGMLPPDLVAASGRTKARNIDWGEMILDPRLQKFLMRDPERMSVRFTEDIAPRIGLRRVFGSENLEDVVLDVRDRFGKAIAAADVEGNAKMASFLRNRQDEFLKDFRGVRDKLLGRLGLPEDPNSAAMWFTRRLREYNFVRMMGRVLLSSVTDIATGQLATNSAFGFLPKLTMNTAKLVAKIPDDELRALLIGYENMLHYSRTLQSFGLDDSAVVAHGFGQGRLREVTGRIGQISQDSTTLMNRLNGMRWWNRRMRIVFGTVAMNNIRKDVANWANLSPKTKTYYLRHGLDEDAANRMAKLFAESSDEIEKGVIIPKSQEWLDKDPQAYALFRDTLAQIMDEAIIVPGAGDLPLVMSKDMGRLMFQFQSFSFAAVNRYLRPLVQRRDGLAMTSAVTGLALGGLNWVAREALNGNLDKIGKAGEDFADKGDTKIFYEALVRSPLIGHLGMPLEFLGQAFGGGVNDITESATGLRPVPQSSRFAERNAFLIPFGPSIGTIEDTVGAGQQILKTLGPNATDEDADRLARKAVRLTPFMSLGYLTALGNAFGVPGFAPVNQQK